ncbi:hypothetical protein V2J09_005817 [Rumex salicifolius]
MEGRLRTNSLVDVEVEERKVFDNELWSGNRKTFIMDITNQYKEAQQRNSARNSKQERVIKLVSWSKPPTPWIKINTDGAVLSNLGATTTGVLKDASGAWISGFGRRLGHCSVLAMELWGSWMASPWRGTRASDRSSSSPTPNWFFTSFIPPSNLAIPWPAWTSNYATVFEKPTVRSRRDETKIEDDEYGLGDLLFDMERESRKCTKRVLGYRVGVWVRIRLQLILPFCITRRTTRLEILLKYNSSNSVRKIHRVLVIIVKIVSSVLWVKIIGMHNKPLYQL